MNRGYCCLFFSCALYAHHNCQCCQPPHNSHLHLCHLLSQEVPEACSEEVCSDAYRTHKCLSRRDADDECFRCLFRPGRLRIRQPNSFIQMKIMVCKERFMGFHLDSFPKIMHKTGFDGICLALSKMIRFFDITLKLIKIT